jgi:signal transduction histidine kinase
VAGDAIRRRVQIRKLLEPDLPLVLGDRFQLQQVLLNLIINGMDAMSHTPESQRRLTLKAKENESNRVQVTVADCGRGVSASDETRIFESFFTTKKDGMGLGLSIAHSIIEAHQGKLWLDRHARIGATFHFTLQTAARSRSVPLN